MKKKLIIILIFLGIISFFLVYKTYKKKDLVFENKIHIIESQKKIDEKLKNELVKTFNNPYIKLNPYGNSPLSAIIIFSTDSEEIVKTKVYGKDNNTTFSHEYEKSKEHILAIYGLYPDTENKVEISVGNNLKTFYIKTEKLPEDLPIKKEMSSIGDGIKNELIFTTPSPSGRYPVAYDNNGDVRWYLTSTHIVTNINYLKNGNLMISSERLASPVYNMVGLYEMSLIGKIYKEYIYEGGYHHDFFEMEDGNILFLSNDYNKKTEHDLIVLMDRQTGNILKKYELDKILPMDQGKQQNWTEKSWFHANSIWYDKSDNSITVSGRHQDIIVNLDYDSGKINWLLGDNTTWDDNMKKYFLKGVGDISWQYAQHSVSKIGDEIYVFDNGNNRSKLKEKYISPKKNYSRAVIYKINKNNFEVSQIYEYGKELGSSHYSSYISSFEKLNDNDYLINFGGAYTLLGQRLNAPAFMVDARNMDSYIIERKNNENIFELNLPMNISRARKMVFNYNFNLSSGEILGNFGLDHSTNEYNFPKEILNETKTRYNFKIEIETDRIQFSTRVFANSDVKLILKSKKDTKVYSQTVSNRFSNYLYININKNNLKGIYKIYVEIDNKLYDINKTIEI